MIEDWIECEFNDVLEIVSGKNQKKVISNEGKYPIYGSGGIIGRAKEYLCEEGTTVIGRKGTINSPIYVKEPFWNVDTAFGLSPFSILENRLLFFYAVFFNFKKLDKSTTIPSLAKRDLLRIKFPLAPLPEQRAIVAKIEELFSDLDKGIADLKIAQEQLKVYRQAVLKKAFEGELTKEWRAKQSNLPTADELLVQIKEERQKHYEKQIEDWKKAVKAWEKHGNESKKPGKPKKLIEISNLKQEELDKLESLPSEWLYSYLVFAGELARGKSKHRPRNDAKLFKNGKYPFIQTGDVKAQKTITEYDKKYSEFGLQQSKLWKKGTLCITIAANIAETGFLGIDACFPDSIVGFTPFNAIIKNHYIEYFFQLAKTRISAYAPATAQKNINLTILENLVVPFCSKEEQRQVVKAIESRLSVCDKVEESIAESLEKAKALRQSILKKAFEGTLLSKEEIAKCKAAKDYEPASVLLEKIKAEKKK